MYVTRNYERFAPLTFRSKKFQPLSGRFATKKIADDSENGRTTKTTEKNGQKRQLRRRLLSRPYVLPVVRIF